MGELCCVTFHQLCELRLQLLALLSASPELRVYSHLALVSLWHYFHQATSINPLKAGPRITLIMDLHPLYVLWVHSDSSLTQAICVRAQKVHSC